MADLIGKEIGDYRIIRELGKGGFADVYLAENIPLKDRHHKDMFVAIKIAQNTLPQKAKEQFFEEAYIISQLKHPHIVRLLHFGLYDNRPYLVMDYIKEGSLRDKHPRGTKLDLLTILNYVKQIADALQYAHTHTHDGQADKTIHRDIKPDNILWESDNSILLSDFGIAIIVETTNYTAGGHDQIGSLPYMSPEHFTGKLRSASDQYSLAAMVYEWLCGATPFHGGNYNQMGYQHTYVEPPPLHDKVAILPAVEKVVMKGLAKDPEQRYENVTKFAEALEEASKFSCEACFPPNNASLQRAESIGVNVEALSLSF